MMFADISNALLLSDGVGINIRSYIALALLNKFAWFVFLWFFPFDGNA